MKKNSAVNNGLGSQGPSQLVIASSGDAVDQITITSCGTGYTSAPSRIWSWFGAFTLSELSKHGVKQGSRIIELIPLTDEAIKNLDQIHE